MKTKILIYLHVPKTGGTTFSKILERKYNKKEIYTISAPVTTVEGLKNLDLNRRNSIKFLHGHMGFNIHKHLDKDIKNCIYITMLRDPITRVISSYYYIRRKVDHHLHKESIELNLKDFIINEKTLNNLATRELSSLDGHEDFSYDFGQVNEVAFKRAKTNLINSFDIVGTTVRFDETLFLTSKLINLKNIYYIRRNVTKNRPRICDLKEDTIETIKKYNKYDIKLYNLAKQLLEKKMNSLSPQYLNNLQKFKTVNYYYNKIFQFYPIVRQRLVNIYKKLCKL